ncbi:hypothetical protein HMF8227_00740 [Saliniradius amylolyticus]|uniref:Uncharacterized protein n=1 Tax=Saliniradius amylolyticus TaxID=2183582 RepID=A0A2S2E0T3_9ALTE|nr:hypothetical protein [Saliniradius amylolyticus]AWL11236.1 hypothetical protein HMF8227_00740 [Saliniradius amylolyticus]
MRELGVFGLLCLSLCIAGCGGDSRENKNYDRTSAYKLTASPDQDSARSYTYLKTQSGECLSDSFQCDQQSPSVTRYKGGFGFRPHVYGHNTTSTLYNELDPFESGELVSVYSGVVGTYSAKHSPVAVSSENYQYFVYSGPVLTDEEQKVATTVNGGVKTSSELFWREDGKTNIIGLYIARLNNHTGKVSAPLLLHAKNTDDPHDNAVLSFDNKGNLIVLASGRGTRRSGLMFYIRRPDEVTVFNSNSLEIREITPDNINYQTLGEALSRPEFASITYPQLLTTEHGLKVIYNVYCYGNHELNCREGTRQVWQASIVYEEGMDKATLTDVRPIAAVEGHYALARVSPNGREVVLAFNKHLGGSVADRANLYLLYSDDGAVSWQYFDRRSSEWLGADTLLPLSTNEEMSRVAVYETELSQPVRERTYLKDLMISDSGYSSVRVLVTRSKGSDSHYPWSAAQHRIESLALVGDVWLSDWQSEDVDHNYSTGFLFKHESAKVGAYFPATPNGMENNLAGGALARVLRGRVDYFSRPLTPGTNGYLDSLCEMNYARGFIGTNGSMLGIAGVANPYQFIGSADNDELPAASLVLIDRQNQWHQLPTRLGEVDSNGEYDLMTLTEGNELECR